jgi:hypothetical protein
LLRENGKVWLNKLFLEMEGLIPILTCVLQQCLEFGINAKVVYSIVQKVYGKDSDMICHHPKCFDENGVLIDEYATKHPKYHSLSPYLSFYTCPDCTKEFCG